MHPCRRAAADVQTRRCAICRASAGGAPPVWKCVVRDVRPAAHRLRPTRIGQLGDAGDDAARGPPCRGARVRLPLDLPACPSARRPRAGPGVRRGARPVAARGRRPGVPRCARPGRAAGLRRGAHRAHRSGDGHDLCAVHCAGAAREDTGVTRRPEQRAAHGRGRHGLDAGGAHRRRRAVRAPGRTDGRVPALPAGAVDAGPGRVLRRVLHRAPSPLRALAGPATASSGPGRRRRGSCAAEGRAARAGLDQQHPAGPDEDRRVRGDRSRGRARGWPRSGRCPCRRPRPCRPGGRRPGPLAAPAARHARAGPRRPGRPACPGRHGGLLRPELLAPGDGSRTSTAGAALDEAERVLDAFAPARTESAPRATPPRPSA